MRRLSHLLAIPMIWFVKAWRLLVSPLYGQVCRYHPSCSAYGLESLQVHGAWPGAWLTVRRIVRCNPWSPGGYDPVPGTPQAEAWAEEQRREAATTGSVGAPDQGRDA